jgi:hypothetical protein
MVRRCVAEIPQSCFERIAFGHIQRASVNPHRKVYQYGKEPLNTAVTSNHESNGIVKAWFRVSYVYGHPESFLLLLRESNESNA